MYHIRFTYDDISGYTFDFLNNYARYIVAYEDKDKYGNATAPHYHILIDTDYGEKSVRDAVKANLKIPKSSRGKNNKYYAFMEDWEDPGYICKYGDIRLDKGFTEKEVLDYVISGKKKYLGKVRGSELSGEVAPAQLLKPKKEPKVPFQQAVIASAAADWYNYKKMCAEQNKPVHRDKVCEFVCAGMREHGRGINVYLVKELGYAILHDDLESRDIILAKIKSHFNS